MGYAIFFTEGDKDGSCSLNASFVPAQEDLEWLWEVSFYGSTWREGAGARVWMRPPRVRALNYSYKISFDCMNNEA